MRITEVKAAMDITVEEEEGFKAVRKSSTLA